MIALNLIFLLFIIKIEGNKRWNHEDIDNPLIDFSFCNISPNIKYYVCDPESYLSHKTKKEIGNFVKDINLASPCSCSCDNNKPKDGLVLGVIVLSELEKSQSNCKIFENYNTCFARNIMQKWKMSSCGNSGLIVIEERDGLFKSNIYFGYSTMKTISKICMNRIVKDVEESLTSISKINAILGRINQYVIDNNYCVRAVDIDDTKWEFKAEVLLGLIIAFSIITIILIFVVPCCKKRRVSANVDIRRNSNIIRPDRQPVTLNSELPPDYLDITRLDKQKGEDKKPEILLVDACSTDNQPPSYSDVLRFSNFKS